MAKQQNVSPNGGDVNTKLAEEIILNSNEGDIEARETSVSERESAASEKEADIEAREISVSERESAVSEKEADIEARETSISEKESEIKKREKALLLKENVLSTNTESSEPGKSFHCQDIGFKFKDSAPKLIRYDGTVFTQEQIISDPEIILDFVSSNSNLIEKR
ncbi:hypothetical protein [Chryseobacterium sp.]|uniref:hypothetical protein n=1 Tax=Chryseobacterium sp. TaxID=1871047 RepID=UPI00261E37C6|nr:hypothetical protein [Chryseobacterium sp.]